jgi:RNA polymerase sigma-70 factor (ECF subfamily)
MTVDMPLVSLVTPTPDAPSDPAALARAARAGDAAALGALYDAYAESLYRTAYRLSGNADDAQDIVHDCFVGLPQALRQYDERGNLSAWLRRVVVRLVLMRRRGDDRRREDSLDLVSALALASSSRADARVELDDVRRVVDALPVALRDVFVLKQIDGYSHEEIAQLLGISAGASRVRLSRALDTLGRALAPRS